MPLVDIAKLPSVEAMWVYSAAKQNIRVPFPALANAGSCQTFALCRSAQWKMVSGCRFHLTSLILSEIGHLFSNQPYG